MFREGLLTAMATRRLSRLRREYLYAKSLEGKEKDMYERKQRIKTALAGKNVVHFRNGSVLCGFLTSGCRVAAAAIKPTNFSILSMQLLVQLYVFSCNRCYQALLFVFLDGFSVPVVPACCSVVPAPCLRSSQCTMAHHYNIFYLLRL
jgi:hypothetical protein